MGNYDLIKKARIFSLELFNQQAKHSNKLLLLLT